MPTVQEQMELDEIEQELRKLARQQQQLLSRKELLTVLQDYKQSTGFMSPSDKKTLTKRTDSTEKTELERIDEQLRDIAEQEGELVNRRKEILFPSQSRPDLCKANGGVFVLPHISDQFAVAIPPPSFPAPQLTLDYNKLPDSPTPTQCPSCQQFVTTETSRKAGNTVWLLCIMAVMFGCCGIALIFQLALYCTLLCKDPSLIHCLQCFLGCCLIPFCVHACKDVVHKCPKCRSKIQKIQRL